MTRRPPDTVARRTGPRLVTATYGGAGTGEERSENPAAFTAPASTVGKRASNPDSRSSRESGPTTASRSVVESPPHSSATVSHSAKPTKSSPRVLNGETHGRRVLRLFRSRFRNRFPGLFPSQSSLERAVSDHKVVSNGRTSGSRTRTRARRRESAVRKSSGASEDYSKRSNERSKFGEFVAQP